MICFRKGFGWAVAFTLFAGIQASAEAPATGLAYNRDILPILSDNCFACHGPDQNKRKAKLRLDVREEAISKKAIVPGQTEESELVRRITSSDPDEVMPPPKSQKKLSSTQIDLLRRWVADGAPYQGHWSYTPLDRPEAPHEPNAIDFLVQKRLKVLGLQPSPEADRRTLARRLYFDLVGVPPKPADVEAFVNDQSSDAYERLTEQLLASPQYGERMAIGWLDVVRYADTIGYHSDNPRNIWPYRDYVIRSFNDNKPFDQFTREQVAGDLLPNSTLEQKVASGFNRLLLSTEEGGAQPKDYESRMLTDRVRAVGAVWLGQTLGCAQCHDHKFDPIKARDFYSMGAFFADINEPLIGRREDGMLVPNERQAAELARLDANIARVRQIYEAPHPDELKEWETAALRTVREEGEWTSLQPEEATATSGHKLAVSLDGTVTAEKSTPSGTDTFRIRVRPVIAAITALRLEALPSDRLPAHGPGFAQDGTFVLTELTVTDDAGNPVEFADATATFETPGAPARAAIDGNLGPNNGWMVPGQSGVPHSIYLALKQPVDAEDGLIVIVKHGNPEHATLGRFRLSATANPAAAESPTATLPPKDIAQIVVLPETARTPEQKDKLVAYFRTVSPALAGARAQLALAQTAKTDYEATVPRSLVSISMEKPRTVRILPRGDWMNETGEIVQPALPGYLVPANQPATNKPLSRLDLAEWLVCRDNPLTARVVINRIWKQFFGMGLSRVLDDFGAQGEQPPNQELLDWLACEFVDSGWDIKHMVRLMVTSHTYKQVSTASRELLNRDPYNRELARQSRWRLDAELVRDNALSIAGLLTTRVGGPSVKPYQPEGYWENLNFPVRSYEASRGEDQYRRGLYTWWQRSYLHPSIVAFDAPTREECAADRPRSNIPQQALALLNDPTYVEAARVFASRILQEGGPDASSRVAWAFQQTLARPPRPDELQTVFNLLYKQLANHAPEAKLDDLLHVGFMPTPSVDPAELAAWTNVARVLLNLHETITRS